MKPQYLLVGALACLMLAAVFSWKNMKEEVKKTSSPIASTTSTPPHTTIQRVAREVTESEFEARTLTGIETTVQTESSIGDLGKEKK